MTNALCSVALLLVAIIHLLPVIGILGAERLQNLYGVALQSSELIILLRHRAVTFGLLGVFFVYAAFRVELQWLAVIAGTISVSSFIAIAYSAPEFNSQIARVVLIDWIALILLLLVAGAKFIVMPPS